MLKIWFYFKFGLKSSEKQLKIFMHAKDTAQVCCSTSLEILSLLHKAVLHAVWTLGTFFSRVKGTHIPVVLDWAIRDDGSCRPPPPNGGASAKPTAPACVSATAYVSTPHRGVGTSAIVPRDTREIPMSLAPTDAQVSFFVFKRMLMLIFNYSKKSHKFFHVSWTGDGQYMVTIHIFSAGACLHDREIVMESLVF
jgi:hypothetical protein